MVKGSVADTISNVKLSNTSISVLNAKDSTLRKFTRAAADGSFSIGQLGKGKFILLATYPKYADYVEEFTLDSAHTTHNVGRISMILKSKLLEGVIVRGTRAAIKIKGDTTEFNASSFTVQPNARVEDLLKQLPGIQVDKDGKITAQGQTVNKVLVDGEEFFGDDPTLVTKNLRADMVDKVQLYDKKSDQATFTGIDDGQKTKTINIKLKEDKKNGYFGKVDAGIGTKDFYQEQFAFNKFWGKKKFSAYGTLANSGKTGLSWEDNSKYGSANNVEMIDGGIYISGSSGDELESFGGQYSGEGIPTARTGGLHFDDKWGGDKYTLNGNYKIGSLGVVGTKNIQNQNNLPGTSASTNQNFIKSNNDQDFNNYIFRQKLDAMYQVKLDTTANLKITVDGTFKNNETRNNNLSTSLRGNDLLINQSIRRIDNEGDQKMFNATGFYTKKLKKTGRTISLNVTEALNQNNVKGNLYQKIDYYDETGAVDSIKLVDQYKINNVKSNVVSTNFTYSEPITKYFAIVANYGFGLNNSTADRRSFSQSAPSVYSNLIDSLSNNYQLNQISHQLGAVFNYKKEKTVLNFGTKVRDVRFSQEDLMSDYRYKRHFLNWNPSANYQYRFSQQRAFNLSYSGSNTQPSIDQVQPVRNNNDDLNITIGNPNLEPSFTHRFNMNYNSYKVLSDQSMYIGGSYNFTTNPIVNNTATDSLTGKSRLQYINLGNNTPSNFSLYSSYGRKVKLLGGVNVGVNLNANGNTYFNLTNNALNRTRSYNFSGQLRLSKYKQKKYDFYGTFGPTYNTSVSSLVKSVNNNGGGFTSYQYVGIYLPGKIQINGEGNYEYRAPTQSFNEKLSRYLLNASVSKAFFKDESLKLAVNAYDLLNQNNGFSRSANGGSLTQTQYTTIRRYFMFTLTWDFNRMGGGAPQK
ncbi:outer membrane beta-barrel protein [Mucilaginibacter sp. PAMB04274]|uniref:outer membrane beta-barrel protein n=1 Tax=Mucilaginibacter sp. PAMB04274 TaxID=3138568 RepID=UPI0031F6CD13